MPTLLTKAKTRSQPRSRPRVRRHGPLAAPPRPEVATLLAGWHWLTPDELACRILCIRRLASKHHLNEHVWRTVDRMRRALPANYYLSSKHGDQA